MHLDWEVLWLVAEMWDLKDPMLRVKVQAYDDIAENIQQQSDEEGNWT